MKFEFKNCINGESAVYKTTLEIIDNGSSVTFIFDAENSMGFCCSPGYNNIHSLGDVFEILIGTDPERKVYYEIELSPIGDLMIAKMTNHGFDENGKPILDLDFVDEPFIDSSVVKTENGYLARLTFDKKNIYTGEGEIYFNAYRIETDGGEPEKHLFALVPTMRGRFHVPSKFVCLKDYT
ncbi:MAG: hypothetical protein J6Q68_03455 [Clostridia bacterium]|nr:hypothetical protein [Clostridia bacterium]